MKKIVLVYAVIVFLSNTSFAQFQYVSPMPGSSMNRTEREIIIRPGGLLQASSLDENLFSVRGSKSGSKEFTITLCRDNKTILLHPSSPFDYNEEVTVSIKRGLKAQTGEHPGDYTFSFLTQRHYTADELESMKKAKEIYRQQEFGYLPVTDNSEKKAGIRDLEGLFKITVNTNPAPGLVFFSAKNANHIPNEWTGYHVITSDGDSMYTKSLNGVSCFQMEDNGNFGVHNATQDRFEELDSNLLVINKIYPANGYKLDGHELEITPDQHVFILAQEDQIVDMTVYNPNYSPNATVTGMVVQEFDPDGNLVFEWRSFDHVAITEALHLNLAGNVIDYLHSNAIEVDTDGNIMVSHRHLDQITKIDINTGNFVWRLGGQLNEFTFINDPDKFTFQHDIRRLPNGNITLWDNGNYHQPPHSKVKEYQLDEVNKTATLVWSYGHPGGIGGFPLFYPATGSAQRLSNGNTFISAGQPSNYSSQFPSMFEVTPAGTIVWEMKLDSAMKMICDRAHKYEWDPCPRPTYGKLTTKEITTTSAKLKWKSVASNLASITKYKVQYKKHTDNTWIQKNAGADKESVKLTGLLPDTKYDWRIETWCNASGTEHSGFTEIKKFTTLPLKISLNSESDQVSLTIFPNPAHDQITITSSGILSELRVIDLTGREIKYLNLEEEYSNTAQIPVNDLTSGSYFIELVSNGQKQVSKVMIQ